MSDDPPKTTGQDALATRWSRIERLHGSDADDVWRWFIDRYYPEIRAMLRRRLPTRFAPQAEADFWGYLYASGALQRADRGRRFRPYLAGVVGNFAKSWLRKHDQGTANNGQLGQIEASANLANEQVELRAWARHTVQLALNAMAEHYPIHADVIRWFYGLGDAEHPEQAPASVLEISARIGKKVAAVHQDLTRGRMRLRSFLEQELRDQSGTEADWRAELQLILAAVDEDRPGLIPPR